MHSFRSFKLDPLEHLSDVSHRCHCVVGRPLTVPAVTLLFHVTLAVRTPRGGCDVPKSWLKR